MKNILDSLAKGDLGAVGDTLKNALSGAGFNGVGNTPTGATQTAGINTDAIREKLKGAMDNVPSGMGGLLGAGALGGLLGALMSGKTGRKLATGALMVGAGALAWKFYRKWSANGQNAEAANPSSRTDSGGWPEALTSAPDESALPAGQSKSAVQSASSDTDQLLLEAMVFAARADGHIDEKERADINAAVESMFPGQDAAALVDSLMDKPLDPASLAARVSNYEQGCDLYRLSCAIIKADHFMERSYLDGLAAALRLTPEDKTRLEQEAAEIRGQNQA